MSDEEFIIEIYACNGHVSQTGYDNHNKGMVYFNYGHGMRGNAKHLARAVVSDLEGGLSKNSGIKLVRFTFPQNTASIPKTIDGFFGRPLVYAGATFLKPLQDRRKIALAREINKISKIEDKGGKPVKLIAEL